MDYSKLVRDVKIMYFEESHDDILFSSISIIQFFKI